MNSFTARTAAAIFAAALRFRSLTAPLTAAVVMLALFTALLALVFAPGSIRNATATHGGGGAHIGTVAIDLEPTTPAANTCSTIGGGAAGIDAGEPALPDECPEQDPAKHAPPPSEPIPTSRVPTGTPRSARTTRITKNQAPVNRARGPTPGPRRRGIEREKDAAHTTNQEEIGANIMVNTCN